MREGKEKAIAVANKHDQRRDDKSRQRWKKLREVEQRIKQLRAGPDYLYRLDDGLKWR